MAKKKKKARFHGRIMKPLFPKTKRTHRTMADEAEFSRERDKALGVESGSSIRRAGARVAQRKKRPANRETVRRRLENVVTRQRTRAAKKK
jgi:hypothetical protein